MGAGNGDENGMEIDHCVFRLRRRGDDGHARFNCKNNQRHPHPFQRPESHVNNFIEANGQKIYRESRSMASLLVQLITKLQACTHTAVAIHDAPFAIHHSACKGNLQSNRNAIECNLFPLMISIRRRDLWEWNLLSDRRRAPNMVQLPSMVLDECSSKATINEQINFCFQRAFTSIY